MFSDGILQIFKIYFLQSTSSGFYFTENYFTYKIAKNPLKKNFESASKKNNDTRRKKTQTLLRSSLHILLLFKNLLIPLVSVFHDALKARIFKNNTIKLKIYLLQRAGGKCQSLARQSLQRTFIIFKKWKSLRAVGGTINLPSGVQSILIKNGTLTWLKVIGRGRRHMSHQQKSISHLVI